MTEYLAKAGKLGTSMMRLTSSVQVNLDYSSEAEGIEMLRVALAATPVSYALFGNSPLVNGRESGYLSYRNIIWQDTDADRTGLFEEAFAADFNFSRYAEIAWHRPLMFAQDKGGHYVAAHGASLEGISKDTLPGVVIDETNKINSIRELFLETRLKPGYVEVRSIDGLRPADRYAAAAFWTGLLYSQTGRELVKRHLVEMNAQQRRELHQAAAVHGLKTKFGKSTLATLASELVAASRDELKRRGFGEESLLVPVENNLRDGVNPAQRVLNAWHGQLRERATDLIEYLAEE